MIWFLFPDPLLSTEILMKCRWLFKDLIKVSGCLGWGGHSWGGRLWHGRWDSGKVCRTKPERPYQKVSSRLNRGGHGFRREDTHSLSPVFSKRSVLLCHRGWGLGQVWRAGALKSIPTCIWILVLLQLARHIISGKEICVPEPCYPWLENGANITPTS